MKDQEDIITCGTIEFRMDKSDTLDIIKKRSQRYIFDLWWESKKGTDYLYVVNQFDMMTIEDCINLEFTNSKNSNNDKEKLIPAS